MARIFLLKGDIANPGYVDIPDEATTIREVIYCLLYTSDAADD